MSTFSGKPFLVLGAGKSGKAAAAALRARGAAVSVLEKAEESAVRRWAAANCGGTVVASPGIPPSDPAMRAAADCGLAIRGELSLGCSLLPRGAGIVAITGSKGKSSLVKLVADALSATGRNAVPCGNYGLPVCEAADLSPPPDVAVVECSSFQLETADEALAPDAAVLLNFSGDHLDRHGSMEAYLDAKLNIFAHCGAKSLALVPAPSEDPANVAEAFERRFPGRPFATFGCGADADFTVEVPHGSYFDNPVLRPAAAAAFAVLRHLGADGETALNAIRDFVPLPHRMQCVARRGGVSWIDNSKATSLAALAASVDMSEAPVLLLAGGRLKEPLGLSGDALRRKGVVKAFVFGECGEKMARHWSKALPCPLFPDLPSAMAAAARDADALAAGTVLLAPGTASFDQFSSYAERGDLFAALARGYCRSGR